MVNEKQIKNAGNATPSMKERNLALSLFERASLQNMNCNKSKEALLFTGRDSPTRNQLKTSPAEEVPVQTYAS